MKFKLKDSFINKYKLIKPDFGFNGLGELVYYRTYSRLKEDGTNEQWFETIKRVVEGTYSIQKRHILKNRLGWNEDKAHDSAEEMYDRMFHMKFLPSGRGLWAMGSSIIEDRGLFAALNNCAFVSTETIDTDKTKAFEFMMDMSMLGVGVGFDVKGEGKLRILRPDLDTFLYEIPDTREGWVESLKHLLNAYFEGMPVPTFDYSYIRAKGLPIKGFGGLSSGYGPLEDLHKSIVSILEQRIDTYLTATDITDIMNLIGVCVVSGNVRRTAQIVFGEYDSDEYLSLKDYDINPQRLPWGWTSNNSIYAKIGMDYSKVAKQTITNGEPGYAWLENMQDYSRMNGNPDFKDIKARGGNPCFSYDTKILTERGYYKIGDLSDVYKNEYFGEPLKLININKEAVSGRAWKSGTKKVISLVYNENGEGHYIKCTPNHVFMTTNGSYEEAQNLKGRRLMPFYKIKDISLANRKYMSLGFIQGDGRTNPAERQVHVTSIFGQKDHDVLHYYDENITYSMLDELGFSKEKLPTRDLPSTFDLWNTQDKLDFITGLYSANGSVLEKAKRITFKSTNFKLIEQIKRFLSDYLEIKSYITTNKSKIVKFLNGEYLCKESYDLNISQYESIKIFAEKIGFIQVYKQQKLENVIFAKAPYIQHIVEGEEEDVYDFTLEDTTHWGVIEGVIAHNCLEQTLESYEMCCLVETFPLRNKDLIDYIRTLKFAYLYAKTITLGTTDWAETNRVQLRNRRIGTSMSGIAQFVEQKGLDTLKDWCETGYQVIQNYDSVYSDWFCVPRSIKTTSIKPSGTVSLLPGVTPGMHFPESNYYIRRMRISANSPLLEQIKDAGYKVEEDVRDPKNTMVVEFPVAIENVRTVDQVSLWEQLNLAAFLQKYWADNQVSCTITFKDSEKHDVEHALNYYQYQLKGVSFLPKTEKGVYEQMPYEEISKERYEEIIKTIKALSLQKLQMDSTPEKYCDNDTCEI